MSREDCIFCKIAAGESPADVVDETDTVIAFKDKFPSAPTHYVIIPKEHFTDIRDISIELWNELRSLALKIAKDNGIDGFRLATNAGSAAMIPHMHMHFLSGIKKDRSV